MHPNITYVVLLLNLIFLLLVYAISFRSHPLLLLDVLTALTQHVSKQRCLFYTTYIRQVEESELACKFAPNPTEIPQFYLSLTAATTPVTGEAGKIGYT